MSVHLKIKSKHLSAEAKIIRLEETKLKHLAKWRARNRQALLDRIQDLANHRKFVVRSAARSTHLAYGFVRGVKYSRIEGKSTRTTPNWKEVERMIVKYSDEDQRVVKQRFAEWKSATVEQKQDLR